MKIRRTKRRLIEWTPLLDMSKNFFRAKKTLDFTAPEQIFKLVFGAPAVALYELALSTKT